MILDLIILTGIWLVVIVPFGLVMRYCMDLDNESTVAIGVLWPVVTFVGIIVGLAFAVGAPFLWLLDKIGHHLPRRGDD